MKLLQEKLMFAVQGMENNILIPLSISLSTGIFTAATHYSDTHNQAIMSHPNYEAYMNFSGVIYATGYSASAVFLGISLLIGYNFLKSKFKNSNNS